MKHIYFFILSLLASSVSFGQQSYSGNGNTGFGGPIGQSSMTISHDVTTVTFTITKGGADFNDAFVLYLDTKSGGRTAIDNQVNDNGDGLRTAISNGDSGGFASTVGFTAGFEVDYAIAVNTSFGGLWEIPASGTIGNNGLTYINTANSTLTTTTQASFTLTVNWADLGLTTPDSFDFVGLYLSQTAYNSDEAYGAGVSSESLGNGDVVFTSAETYNPPTLSTTDNNIKNANVKVISNELLINNYNGDLNIKIYDILGKNVKNKTNIQVNNTYRYALDLPKNNIYIVVLETKSMTKTIKILL
ncbi:MAG TPA: T9SS type A sorting domain-containing protein [Flavobacteriaceae bacterium]|nr:T9SS type A sorting domain-containing protein [Flavobacteriaceae bacterium]